ncbi:Uncharacterized protein HZ326_15655 [Fusarium oxysporum f. sp. albedinis]|nr:Uncharacterized protein HZ326_15655 [Fusarium oxysporum f. sp. albedinis]
MLIVPVRESFGKKFIQLCFCSTAVSTSCSSRVSTCLMKSQLQFTRSQSKNFISCELDVLFAVETGG